jgi:hypothetical protein
MTEEREFVSAGEAIALVSAYSKATSPDGQVHTYRDAHGILLGAGWPLATLITTLQEANGIEIAGRWSQDLGHGLAIRDEQGWLFIATHEPGSEVSFETRSELPGGQPPAGRVESRAWT